MIAGRGAVAGHDADRRPALDRLEAVRDPGVEPPPGAAEQAPVRGVVDQADGRTASRRRRRSGRSARRRPGARRSSGSTCSPRTSATNGSSNRHADDRRDPEHRPRLLAEGVDPRPEQRPQRHRQARPDRTAVVGQPAVRGRRVAPARRPRRPPPAEDRPDRLGDEQRVAGRSAGGAAARRTGPSSAPATTARELAGLGLAEADEAEALDAGERRVGGRRAGPRPEHDRERPLGGDADDLVEHAGARRVQPVEVVDDDHARTVETSMRRAA